MKKFIGFAFLLASASFLLYSPIEIENIFVVPQQVIKQSIQRKESSKLRESKINKIDQTTNEAREDLTQELDQWEKAFNYMGDSCKKFSREYFNDQNYIDAEMDEYKDASLLIERLELVYQKTLQRKESRAFFSRMLEEVNDCTEQQMKKFESVFREVEVCRESEPILFIETIFEASRTHSFSREEKTFLHKKLVELTSDLIDDQLTLENSLFVLSILKKIPYEWRQTEDHFVLEEIDSYYEEVLDIWNNYTSFTNNIDENDACRYFGDYFREVEYVNNRVKELVRDLKIN